MTFSSFSLSFQVLDHHLIMNWWMDLFFFCFTDFKVFNKSSLELISNEFYFRCNDRLWNKKIIYKIDVIIIIIIIDHWSLNLFLSDLCLNKICSFCTNKHLYYCVTKWNCFPSFVSGTVSFFLFVIQKKRPFFLLFFAINFVCTLMIIHLGISLCVCVCVRY